jgi:hypothetical protein
MMMLTKIIKMIHYVDILFSDLPNFWLTS